MPDVFNTDPAFSYSVVSPGISKEQLEAYLYGHTMIKTLVRFGDSKVAYVLQTLNNSQERADYLANYQVDRLSSGMFGAKHIGSSFPDAMKYASSLIADSLPSDD